MMETTHVRAMKFARQLMHTDVMSPFVAEELQPGTDVVDDDALLTHARNTGATLYHPVGTCKMGIDANAVVDASLKVRGVDGLRVVDASIMPAFSQWQHQCTRDDDRRKSIGYDFERVMFFAYALRILCQRLRYLRSSANFFATHS